MMSTKKAEYVSAVSAPQHQRLSTSNLANQVIIAKNSKLGSSE